MSEADLQPRAERPKRRVFTNLTWLKLVRTFDSAVDGGEGVAEVVG